jgi:hypothetical protein
VAARGNDGGAAAGSEADQPAKGLRVVCGGGVAGPELRKGARRGQLEAVDADEAGAAGVDGEHREGTRVRAHDEQVLGGVCRRALPLASRLR